MNTQFSSAFLLDCVHFKGFHDEILAVLPHYHCYLHTASFEGFGNCFVEAWFSGLPVVSYMLRGALPSLLNNDHLGALVSRDADALSFVNEILRHSSKRFFVESLEFRRSYAKTFTADIICRQYLSTLNE